MPFLGIGLSLKNAEAMVGRDKGIWIDDVFQGLADLVVVVTAEIGADCITKLQPHLWGGGGSGSSSAWDVCSHGPGAPKSTATSFLQMLQAG